MFWLLHFCCHLIENKFLDFNLPDEQTNNIWPCCSSPNLQLVFFEVLKVFKYFLTEKFEDGCLYLTRLSSVFFLNFEMFNCETSVFGSRRWLMSPFVSFYHLLFSPRSAPHNYFEASRSWRGSGGSFRTVPDKRYSVIV